MRELDSAWTSSGRLQCKGDPSSIPSATVPLSSFLGFLLLRRSMDQSTRLDHAVFQLTPTRTRCDLLVCSHKGGAYEKIASGLLEPFLSHLRCAREQIPKGGYSFTLRPPTTAGNGRAGAGGGGGGGGEGGEAAAAPPPWFTKGTLERFVRFVRTPEILERVAAIEKEIVHIESCVQPATEEFSSPPTATATATVQETTSGGTGKAEQQGLANSHSVEDDNSRKETTPPKVKIEANGHDATHGENSKVCLQQILETRRAVLLKEQGMAYARAAVAGYEVDHIDDLISFADAFGASRLREACINFQDLCKKKEKDKIWMDELAAMETRSYSELSCIGTSGIMLASNDHPELNGTFRDAVADPTLAAAGSNAGQDNNGQTPCSEAWNGVYQEKYQVPMGWPSHAPQYMYNFQNPAQQMPPYPGYAFSGMFPPFYPGQFDNAQQPQFKEVSDLDVAGDAAYSHQRRYRSSSSKHNKPVKTKETKTTTTTPGSRDEETFSDSAKSGSESDEEIHHDASPEEEVLGKGRGHKRSNKKSSKTVIIRNINFISPEKRDGEDGLTNGSSSEGDINGGLLESIVGSLDKYHKASPHQHKKKGKNRDRRNIHGNDDSFDQNGEIDAHAKVGKETKGDESWNAFQNILMRDDHFSSELHGENGKIPTDGNEQHNVYAGNDNCVIKNSHLETPIVRNLPLDTDSLRGTRPKLVATDPIAASSKDDNCQDKGCSEIFDCDENYRKSMKRSQNVDEELLFSERAKSESVDPDATSAYANETVIRSRQRGEDLFIVSKSKGLQDGDPSVPSSIFEGDQSWKSSDGVGNEKTANEPPIDDSFIVVTRSTGDDNPISQWETDMSIVSGLAFSAEIEGVGVLSHSTENKGVQKNHEPDDLYMVLERDPGIEPVGTLWPPEIDYSADITYNVTRKSDSTLEDNGTTDVSNNPPASKDATSGRIARSKVPSKDAKSKPLHGNLMRAKSDLTSRNKKPSIMSKEAIQKNKMLKEEENRKRLEDLSAQRQKRIAERSSASSTSPATTKVSGAESKLGTASSKHGIKAPRSAIQGTNRPKVLA